MFRILLYTKYKTVIQSMAWIFVRIYFFCVFFHRLERNKLENPRHQNQAYLKTTKYLVIPLISDIKSVCNSWIYSQSAKSISSWRIYSASEFYFGYKLENSGLHQKNIKLKMKKCMLLFVALLGAGMYHEILKQKNKTAEKNIKKSNKKQQQL